MADRLSRTRLPSVYGSRDMPFMVIYRNGDGSSGYEQVDAIDGAARFVERLRNNDSIDQIRLFRMEEINFAFRQYYKVELGAPERPPAKDAAPPVTKDTNGNPPTGTGTSGVRLGLFQR
jgi:hypothetical protein